MFSMTMAQGIFGKRNKPVGCAKQIMTLQRGNKNPSVVFHLLGKLCHFSTSIFKPHLIFHEWLKDPQQQMHQKMITCQMLLHNQVECTVQHPDYHLETLRLTWKIKYIYKGYTPVFSGLKLLIIELLEPTTKDIWCQREEKFPIQKVFKKSWKRHERS